MDVSLLKHRRRDKVSDRRLLPLPLPSLSVYIVEYTAPVEIERIAIVTPKEGFTKR